MNGTHRLNFALRGLMMRRSILCCAVGLGGICVGCDTVPAEKYFVALREKQTATETIERLEQQVGDEQKAVSLLQQQVATLRGLKEGQFDELVVPVRIQLASQSGGYDLDRKAGDDGILLYIQPIDRDGHVIKAAGSIQVTLIDLTEPTTPKVMAPYQFDVAKTRSLWYGRLMTHHFTVRCPWPPSGPPAGDEVTALIEFTDLLSGKTLRCQDHFKIEHAPKLAASVPAP